MLLKIFELTYKTSNMLYIRYLICHIRYVTWDIRYRGGGGGGGWWGGGAYFPYISIYIENFKNLLVRNH